MKKLLDGIDVVVSIVNNEEQLKKIRISLIVNEQYAQILYFKLTEPIPFLEFSVEECTSGIQPPWVSDETYKEKYIYIKNLYPDNSRFTFIFEYLRYMFEFAVLGNVKKLKNQTTHQLLDEISTLFKMIKDNTVSYRQCKISTFNFCDSIYIHHGATEFPHKWLKVMKIGTGEIYKYEIFVGCDQNGRLFDEFCFGDRIDLLGLKLFPDIYFNPENNKSTSVMELVEETVKLYNPMFRYEIVKFIKFTTDNFVLDPTSTFDLACFANLYDMMCTRAKIVHEYESSSSF